MKMKLVLYLPRAAYIFWAEQTFLISPLRQSQNYLYTYMMLRLRRCLWFVFVLRVLQEICGIFRITIGYLDHRHLQSPYKMYLYTKCMYVVAKVEILLYGSGRLQECCYPIWIGLRMKSHQVNKIRPFRLYSYRRIASQRLNIWTGMKKMCMGMSKRKCNDIYSFSIHWHLE